MANKIANLQFNKNSSGTVYYRYRQPDGTYFPLGKDRDTAELAALALNEKRAAMPKAKPGSKTMLELINAFEPVKLRSTKSAASIAQIKRKLQRYREWLGDCEVSAVTVEQLDVLLEEKAPTSDPYRQHRLMLGELFAFAIGKGWRRGIDGNPGADLLRPKLARVAVPKQRKRLTLEQFHVIREQAPEWLQVAMDISLQTGLRRGDICSLRMEDYRAGALFVMPAKTAELPDPVAIKINAGAALADALERAENLKPTPGPMIVRKLNNFDRTGEAADRKCRTAVLPEQLTRHFKMARDKCDVFKRYRAYEKPTFHEIRALCAWLYKKQGRKQSSVQTLLGHGSAEMTAHYEGGHAIQWAETYADLKVDA